MIACKRQIGKARFFLSIGSICLGFIKPITGQNFKSKVALVQLADYVRQIAGEVIPEKNVETVHLLTFPRILGAVFNPLSVYVAGDASGSDILYIYEVRNTFGDMHAYIGAPTPNHATLEAEKILHVSPFFPLKGHYRLRLRMDDGAISLAMRYLIDDRPALTATLRGTRRRLANRHLFQSLVKTRTISFQTNHFNPF